MDFCQITFVNFHYKTERKAKTVRQEIRIAQASGLPGEDRIESSSSRTKFVFSRTMAVLFSLFQKETAIVSLSTSSQNK